MVDVNRFDEFLATPCHWRREAYDQGYQALFIAVRW